MDRKRFLELLENYLQGRATPEEKTVIDAWYESMGRSSIDGMEGEDEDVLEQRYLSIIDNRIAKQAGKYRMVVIWRSLKIAATIIFAIAASFSIWSGSGQKAITEVSVLPETSTRFFKRIVNDGEVSQRVTMPDGSLVVLEPQSEVKFLAGYNETSRYIWLEGEAFFDVCPDKTRPFVVHARGLTTKVVGTSFTVRAFKHDKDVAVAVRTGKVFVVTSEESGHNARKEEVVLTPNQKVVYDKVRKKLARTIVEQPQIILPNEEVRQMRFEAAPVSVIFDAIEKVYGVDLVFDANAFESCTLTSVISDGELFNRLDIICKAIGASYVLEGNQIVIEGSACNVNYR